MKIGKTEKKILKSIFKLEYGTEKKIRDLIKIESPIYNELNILIKKGLIKKRKDIKEKYWYSLTPQGFYQYYIIFIYPVLIKK